MKPFDKIIYRKGNNPWNIAHFSHVSNEMLHTSEFSVSLSEVVFFPFEGNEKLVGTTNNVGDEVFLPEGTKVYASDDPDSLLGWTVCEFEKITDTQFFEMTDEYCYLYIILPEFFDINNWEKTKKHILEVNEHYRITPYSE